MEMTTASKQLSPTMEECLTALKEAGSMQRLPGGFWHVPGSARYPHNGLPVEYFGTKTIEALVSRRRAEYSGWIEGRRGRFPSEVRPLSCGGGA